MNKRPVIITTRINVNYEVISIAVLPALGEMCQASIVCSGGLVGCHETSQTKRSWQTPPVRPFPSDYGGPVWWRKKDLGDQ